MDGSYTLDAGYILLFRTECRSIAGTSGGFAKFLAKILYRDFNTIDKPSQDILINKCQFIVRKTALFYCLCHFRYTYLHWLFRYFLNLNFHI